MPEATPVFVSSSVKSALAVPSKLTATGSTSPVKLKNRAVSSLVAEPALPSIVPIIFAVIKLKDALPEASRFTRVSPVAKSVASSICDV